MYNLFLSSLNYSQYTEEEKQRINSAAKSGAFLELFGGAARMGMSFATNRVVGHSVYDAPLNAERRKPPSPTQAADASKPYTSQKPDLPSVSKTQILKPEYSVYQNMLDNMETSQKSENMLDMYINKVNEQKPSNLIDNGGESDIIKDIKSCGIKGDISLGPQQIDLTGFYFDEEHMNIQRSHGVDRNMAIEFMKNAKVSILRWGGDFVCFYSEDGAVYVDVKNKRIRTAFTKNEYSDNVIKMMEVLTKNGR